MGKHLCLAGGLGLSLYTLPHQAKWRIGKEGMFSDLHQGTWLKLHFIMHANKLVEAGLFPPGKSNELGLLRHVSCTRRCDCPLQRVVDHGYFQAEIFRGEFCLLEQVYTYRASPDSVMQKGDSLRGLSESQYEQNYLHKNRLVPLHPSTYPLRIRILNFRRFWRLQRFVKSIRYVFSTSAAGSIPPAGTSSCRFPGMIDNRIAPLPAESTCA